MLPVLFITFIFLVSPRVALAQVTPSFECLNQTGTMQIVSGSFNTDKFEPTVESNKKFDARSASFEYPETISHSMVTLGNGDPPAPMMCWAGGYFTASKSWHDLDISWEESKQGYDDTADDRGEMNNTTSATSYHDSMTWTGLHVYNMHDGIRTNNTYNNWTIQHSWFEYIRDDCVENDSNYSGTIYDVLFDGCYGGLSNQDEVSGAGEGQIITIDKALIRMEPMPYPYKWDTKDDPVVYIEGYNIPGTSNPIPFGHGNVFKGDPIYWPQFEITNTAFLLEYDSEKIIFPPAGNVDVCSNNTIIWLGENAAAPNYLLTDFPGCFNIITDPVEGKAFWAAKVADWHERHPLVGAERKPESYDYKWPRYDPVSATITPTSTPVNTPGDADGNGVVDGLDYLIWFSHYSMQTQNGNSDGDFDSNGLVDGIDYLIWLSNYSF